MDASSRSSNVRRRLARASWLVWLVAPLLVTTVTYRAASGQYRVFWGDVHGHTSHSDGKGSLDDYFTHARDVSKLDFVIVSDHDFGNGKPTWWMPKAT